MPKLVRTVKLGGHPSKTCIVCGDPKLTAEFEPGRNQCMVCRRLYRLRYRASHREYTAKYGKAYYKVHSEVCKSRSKQRYWSNKVCKSLGTNTRY